VASCGSTKTLETSKPAGLKMWLLLTSLLTGARAASVQLGVAVLALVVTKRCPARLLPPSSAPARPA
jgi:hypothetical protein